MTTAIFDRLTVSGAAIFDRLTSTVGLPTITAIGAVQDGAAIALTMTNASASGNSVFALQGAKILQLIVASEGTTSITTGPLDCSGIFVTGVLMIYVVDNSGNVSNVVTVSIVPATGQAAFLVTQPFLGDPSSRISATPDLAFGDEVRIRNVSGGVITDTHFTGQAAGDAASAVTSFEAAAFDGQLLGTWAIQQRTVPISTVTVPNIVGQATTTAQANLIAVGLIPVIVATLPSATVAAGLVSAEFPAASTVVALNSVVELTISQGIVQGLVPDLTGLDLPTAFAELATAGLSLISVSYVAGGSDLRVTNQTLAAGSTVAVGSSVGLELSLGSAGQITVPDFTGESVSSANLAALLAYLEPSFSRTSGSVRNQDLTAGSLANPGSAIVFTVFPYLNIDDRDYYR